MGNGLRPVLGGDALRLDASLAPQSPRRPPRSAPNALAAARLFENMLGEPIALGR